MVERRDIPISALSTEMRDRLDDWVRAWRVVTDRLLETETSVLAFGRRGGDPVVVKIIKARRDEWRSGGILAAFEGKGVVRVYEHIEGAMLMERLRPGRSLVGVAL